MKRFLSESPEETKQIGKKILDQYGPTGVFCLFGPLAAGKTTLIKGIAQGLGITATVVSPTYMLVRQYDNDPPLVHLDLFRIQSSEEFIEAGLEEYLLSDRFAVAIEWADRIEDVLPGNRIDLHIEIKGDSRREITLHARS